MSFARPLLPFFRPLAVPRPATTSQFLRFSQCARLRDQAAPSAETASTTSPADANALPTGQAQPVLLPYHISRSRMGELPVYAIRKRGGNLRQTKVRRISGDIETLRKELVAYLDLSPDLVKINPVTQHIIMKGWYQKEVTKFLADKKF